jgi:hypothetical protein
MHYEALVVEERDFAVFYMQGERDLAQVLWLQGAALECEHPGLQGFLAQLGVIDPGQLGPDFFDLFSGSHGESCV